MGFHCSSVSKESACNAGDPGSISGLGRFPGEGTWQPTSVFSPVESHGQRSLPGSSVHGVARVRHDLETKPKDIVISTFFQCRSFFKVFIEFVTILVLFYVCLFVFGPRSMWYPSSLRRYRTCTPLHQKVKFQPLDHKGTPSNIHF